MAPNTLSNRQYNFQYVLEPKSRMRAVIFPTRNAPENFSQISVKLKTLNFVVGNLTLLSAIAAHMAVKL